MIKQCNSCNNCNKQFAFIRRKYMCKHCLNIFCSKCCYKKNYIILCNTCNNLITEQSSEINNINEAITEKAMELSHTKNIPNLLIINDLHQKFDINKYKKLTVKIPRARRRDIAVDIT